MDIKLIPIIVKAKNGDDRAFEILVHIYYQKVLNFFKGKLQDEDIALDLTQEVFVKVLLNVKKLKFAENFETWLFTIARNELNHYLRKKQKDKHIFQKILDKPPGEVSFSLEKSEVEELLKELPEKYQTALKLFYFEAKSIKEISLITKNPENTVKSWLYRGREILKSLLLGGNKND
ncbi:RNA polymerase sigma factor [Carboxydothermus ferrireducens]|uniref:RNA polymerase sigma factor n=1 Tax=Carboxydothermus ferrireducens DSM 11255 TaxID=1119529 RepID=A0ABX2RBL2_9THEO|nr:RNA polymerase sigma factor [Carboxydothermus ferrireducens]NYE58579.1 RNA polymerase sigma-70 factor (ECF subfamily) [Carboxydothermus ferrireducens DSM 11255]